MRQIKRVKNLINNERGSGMLLVMVGMLMAAIFIALLFFDFSNVFIHKRVTQTGADAAALAAAKSSREYMEDELQKETQKELEALGARWEAFLAAALAAVKEDEEPPSEEDILADFIRKEEASHGGRSMPGDVVSWLRSPSVEVEANPAMRFFFGDDGVSDLACEAVRDNFDNARKEAEKFAKENQNDKVKTLNFIGEDFRVYVVTERKAKFTTVSDESISAITSEASVKIGEPKTFTIKCD
ncbi:pilus assembly protein TadG-related protein [Bacillus sp. JJ1773]|uniref:pilus assembly protein TadG-related protein n=1 Tax=Bacillus sp. JJ1773 TaxID=3122965 RepID=UPI002FFFD868